MLGTFLAHYTSNQVQLCSKDGQVVLGTLHPVPCQVSTTSFLQQKKVSEVKPNRALVLSHDSLGHPGRKVGMITGQVGRQNLSCSPLPQDHGPPQSIHKQGLSKCSSGCGSSKEKMASQPGLAMPPAQAGCKRFDDSAATSIHVHRQRISKHLQTMRRVSRVKSMPQGRTRKGEGPSTAPTPAKHKQEVAVQYL